jgi:uncharacterized membrane protein
MLANRRWLGIGLAVSIALNLFLGGIVAGRLTGQATQTLQAKRHLDEVLEPLPEAKRAAFRRELRQVMPQIRRDLQSMRQARAALAEEFLQPQPDPAAIDRHFKEVQSRTTAMQEALQQAFKRAAADLTLEERRALIETARRRAPRAGIPDI